MYFIRQRLDLHTTEKEAAISVIGTFHIQNDAFNSKSNLTKVLSVDWRSCWLFTFQQNWNGSIIIDLCRRKGIWVKNFVVWKVKSLQSDLFWRAFCPERSNRFLIWLSNTMAANDMYYSTFTPSIQDDGSQYLRSFHSVALIIEEKAFTFIWASFWAFWHITTTTFFKKRSINVLGLNKSLSTSFKWRIGRRSRASCTMRKKRWSILEHKTIDHHNKFSLENSFSQLTSIARKLKKRDCSVFTDLQLIPSCLQPSCSFEQFVSLFAAFPHLALFTSRLWLIPFDVVTKPFIKRTSF